MVVFHIHVGGDLRSHRAFAEQCEEQILGDFDRSPGANSGGSHGVSWQRGKRPLRRAKPKKLLYIIERTEQRDEKTKTDGALSHELRWMEVLNMLY